MALLQPAALREHTQTFGSHQEDSREHHVCGTRRKRSVGTAMQLWRLHLFAQHISLLLFFFFCEGDILVADILTVSVWHVVG